MPSISLNFINQSNDINNSQVVIFEGPGPEPSFQKKDTLPVPLKTISLGKKAKRTSLSLPPGMHVIHINILSGDLKTVQPPATISLKGVAKANIVLSGGQSGKAQPLFEFALEKVVML